MVEQDTAFYTVEVILVLQGANRELVQQKYRALKEYDIPFACKIFIALTNGGEFFNCIHVYCAYCKFLLFRFT